jgi:predicted transcriptional regulator
MRRSQLEMHLKILEILDHVGPLKLTHVMNRANVNCSLLKESFDFLTKQGLVEEKIIGKERKVYAITPLGLKVLKQFRELKEVLPIIEKPQGPIGSKAQIL